MTHVYVYYTLLIVAVLSATLRGEQWAKEAAYVALAASIATTLAAPFPIWNGIDVTIALIDLVVLVAFWSITIRSNRFWPYWITAWQLIAMMAHVQRLVFDEIQPVSYAFLTMNIAYPTLALIILISVLNFKKTDKIRVRTK